MDVQAHSIHRRGPNSPVTTRIELPDPPRGAHTDKNSGQWCLIFRALDGIRNRQRWKTDWLAPNSVRPHLIETLMRCQPCTDFFSELCSVQSLVSPWAYRWNGS